MKKTRFLFLPMIVLLFPVAAHAEPGKGPGGGHGRMPDDFRGVIHELFANHDAFTRSVEITRDGYRATTKAKDPARAALLRKHVAQMESRLDGGMGVRHWDPAFAEFREHYGDMKIEIEKIEGGIAVEVVGTTPEAIEVVKNHAKIISGFIEKGSQQMHAKHPAVLPESKTGPAAAAACGSCGKGACGCGKGKGKGRDLEEGARGKGQKPCCAARAGEVKKEGESK